MDLVKYIVGIGRISYYNLIHTLIKKEVHSEKYPARPMLFYNTHYWHQF